MDIDFINDQYARRAIRRHHRARLKQSRRFHFGRDLRQGDPAIRSRVVDTPCPCSCFLCGNPRRHGDLNRADRRLDQIERDEINCLYDKFGV